MMMTNAPTPPVWVNSPRLLTAFAFGAQTHATQVRRYDNIPYFYHPVEVANTLDHWFGNHHDNLANDFMIGEDVMIAALLHDVVEDQGVSYTTIERFFGPRVRDYVFYLSDPVLPEMGNRATRKDLSRLLLSHAPLEVKLIKAADIKSNAISIMANDTKFAVTYVAEVSETLETMFPSAYVYARVEHFLESVWSVLYAS